MNVNLKFIKPIGGVIIVVLLMLGVVVSFTAHLGVPAPYKSQHDTAYYTQNAGTMNELLTEVQANVLPSLDGISDSYVDTQNMKIVVDVNRDNYDKAVAVISRDFDQSMFDFVETPS